MWMISSSLLLLELHFPIHKATLVYCENVSAIYLSGNPVQHQRTKHIEMEVGLSKNFALATSYVNFIHQKDAFIAMKVVENMMKLNAPIYTVHENFITNVSNCTNFPHIYLQVMKEMGPPLKRINSFLIQNLILPIEDSKYRRIQGKEKMDFSEGYNDVFTEEDINIAINLNIPDHIKKDKKKREAWENKRDKLTECYKGYSKSVTGGSNTWEGHLKM
uniref:Uncharacterized protein orf217b n=1 Tax=Beta vulgaris subsp. maritima TaxID=350892 RepID=E8ZC38_BETVM|nr:hypothetical protein [Beta vulgaris subsp. maritima]